MSRPLKDFLTRAERQFSVLNSGQPYGDWLETNTVLRGRPFSMSRYPFQREIANDMHPDLAVIKCSQVGLTEVQIRKALAFVKRMKGTTCIYTMPDEEMFKKVSQMRVQPCIQENDIFRQEQGTKAVRSMSTMQFGTSFLLMTNATEGAATSTPADYIIHDEVDLTDQAMMALFASRLQNSEWKLKHKFSTPTFHSFGIDADYEPTDQREWTVRCPSCRHEQVPEFNRSFVRIPGLPDHIEKLEEITEGLLPKLDLDGAHVVCEKCGTALDLDDDNRRWVARRPDVRHARGYRVRPLSTSRIGIPYIIRQLMEYRRKDFIRGWYNTTLGEPYVDGSIRLERADLEACTTNHAGRLETDPSQPHWLGIDMGLTCHLVLGVGPSPEETVLFETVPAGEIVERVRALCKQVNVVAGGCDRHPYTPTAVDIFEASGRKVFPVEYRGNAEVNLVYDEFKRPSYAQADKTALLDAVSKAVRTAKIKLSGYGRHKETIYTHFRDNIRDEKPDKPAQWVKLKGEDHFFHATGFMLFAHRLHGVLQPQTDVETRSCYAIDKADWVPAETGLLRPRHSEGIL